MRGSRQVAAILVLSCAALNGCGSDRNQPDSTAVRAGSPPSHQAAPVSSVPQVGTSSATVARNYALAVRSWDARTFRAQFARAVALSDGSLHDQLVARAPTDEQVAALEADHADAVAEIVSVARLPVRSPRKARVRVVLNELRTTVTGPVEHRTINVVNLARRGNSWKVTAFTVQP